MVRRTCVAVSFCLLAIPAAAQASTVPVDPGPIASGRPIVGTTQNLPSLDANTPYDAGPGFAPQIRQIYESGEIRRLQRQVAQEAWRTIRTWVRHHCPDRSCRPTVVFDVDDTMLNNYREYATNDPSFSYNPAKDVQFALACKATANVPVRRLYSKVVDAGLRVAVITGRPADQRVALDPGDLRLPMQVGVISWVTDSTPCMKCGKSSNWVHWSYATRMGTSTSIDSSMVAMLGNTPRSAVHAAILVKNGRVC